VFVQLRARGAESPVLSDEITLDRSGTVLPTPEPIATAGPTG
jgi:hypothetical protein